MKKQQTTKSDFLQDLENAIKPVMDKYRDREDVSLIVSAVDVTIRGEETNFGDGAVMIQGGQEDVVLALSQMFNEEKLTPLISAVLLQKIRDRFDI